MREDNTFKRHFDQYFQLGKKNLHIRFFVYLCARKFDKVPNRACQYVERFGCLQPLKKMLKY